MSLSPFPGLLVEAVDVGLELRAIDPPHAPATDLDRGKVTRPDECINLRDADVQISGDVLIVLMTSALVVAIWGVARGRLVSIVETALDTVCGPIGC